MLRVRMFGRFEVWRGEVPIPESAWFTRRAKQLLKILLLARGKPVPSDQLLDWLWPHSDPQRAAITLRSTVHALRRALEPDRPPRASQYILSQPPGYVVARDAPLWVDVWAFEDLLEAAGRATAPEERRARLMEALSLYRDDLLIEDPYAEWALSERERLRERYMEAALDLAELLAAAGAPEKAIPLCRRVLALDEFREPAYRALMRYQIAVGDMAGALSTYERCRQVMMEAFGVEPSPPTRALYEALLRGELPSARSTRLLQPVQDLPLMEGMAGEVFVGREAELERLWGVFAGLSRGRGGVGVLIGEPGAGKTRLAVEAIRRFAQNADVLYIRGLFIERTLPFSCLAEGLRRLLSQLSVDRRGELPLFALAQVAQLIPSLHLLYPNLPTVPETTPEENRHRLIDGFSNLIIALADQHPLVMFVDDLHWADEATLTVVGRLARRASRHPLVLLLAHTPEEEPEGREVSHLLEMLRREGIGCWIRVGRLSLEALTAWLARLSEEPSERLTDLARRLHSLTEGNALFTAELLRAALAAGGSFRREALERYLDGPAAISSLRALIADRVARLPEGAREILEIAAVIGRAFPVRWLELIGPPDPEPHLRILLERHFLREDAEERLSFVHDVVRRVIYEAIPPVVRRRRHQRLAEALATLYGLHPGPYSAEIAYHFQRAGRAALPSMVRYAVEAGDHARRAYGFRQAVRHYDEALSAAAQSPGDGGLTEWIRRAYLGRGMALEALGDWEGIVETYTRFREWAEAQGDRVHALNAARRLMTTLAMLGRLEEAGELAGEIRAQFASELSLAEADLLDRLELVFGEESALLSSGEGLFQPAPPLWGRPWVDLAEALAPEQAPLLLNLYGWILTLQGMADPAEACLHQALTIAEATAQWPHVVMSCNLMAYLQDLRGDFAEAQAWLNKGLQLARRVPEMDWSTIWARIFQGYLALRARQLEEAQAQFRSVVTLLKSQSALRAHRLSAQIGLGMAFLARGDLERATALLDEALAQGRAVDAVARSVGLIGEARLARLRGHGPEARALLEQALRYTGRRGLVVEFVHAAVEAGRWARAVGHPEEARPILEEARRWADAAGFRPAALMARIALGKVLRAAGEMGALETVRAEARRLWQTLAAHLPGGEPVERYLVPREVVETL
ncbi:Transcriptional regulatory protein MoaR1 [Candidatus Thermoflexus japonica]|uniref:Transcriptional regulatory protein MoaR1 n=1 Tax=Candidatus Thermoflexus japonica TaxID=2035417 RepID=A0A2H5Y925_9CHLR|nr:Transcriptional regulatory protein MoaR1 [Candidatus Thermoflexus japonica]